MMSKEWLTNISQTMSQTFNAFIYWQKPDAVLQSNMAGIYFGKQKLMKRLLTTDPD